MKYSKIHQRSPKVSTSELAPENGRLFSTNKLSENGISEHQFSSVGNTITVEWRVSEVKETQLEEKKEAARKKKEAKLERYEIK